jgi:hypothetical protein
MRPLLLLLLLSVDVFWSCRQSLRRGSVGRHDVPLPSSDWRSRAKMWKWANGNTGRTSPPGSEGWLHGVGPTDAQVCEGKDVPFEKVRPQCPRPNACPSRCRCARVSNGTSRGYCLLSSRPPLVGPRASKLAHRPHSQTSLGSDPRPTTSSFMRDRPIRATEQATGIAARLDSPHLDTPGRTADHS